MHARQRQMSAGELLRQWRKAAGLRQEDAATRLDITKTMVCQYELGQKLPRSNIQARIQVLTGIPMITWHPEAFSEVKAA